MYRSERTNLAPPCLPESSLILAERCSTPLLRRRSGGSEKGSTKASPMKTSGISKASGSDAVSAAAHTEVTHHGVSAMQSRQAPC